MSARSIQHLYTSLPQPQPEANNPEEDELRLLRETVSTITVDDEIRKFGKNYLVCGFDMKSKAVVFAFFLDDLEELQGRRAKTRKKPKAQK